MIICVFWGDKFLISSKVDDRYVISSTGLIRKGDELIRNIKERDENRIPSLHLSYIFNIFVMM